MVKLVLKYCVQKKVIKLDSKLTQNFYDNKTGFVRPGHKFQQTTQCFGGSFPYSADMIISLNSLID